MTRFWIFLFLVALIFPLEASASDAFVSEICNAINIVSGPAGKVFAAFAIVSVGIGFFTGKVSWGLLVGVSVGIATMFGAPSIVSAITGKPTFQCSNTFYYGACVDGVCSSCPTGFTGITCEKCAEAYEGDSCGDCKSGYGRVNGICKKSCDISSVPGVNQISVLHGSTSTACNVARYSGSINYTCDNGSFTLVGGSSCSCSGDYGGANCQGCATGYTDANCGTCDTGYTRSNGSCQQDCLVRSQPGLSDTTVMPGTGSIRCASSAILSVDYDCSGGIFSITGSCTPTNSQCFMVSENETLRMTAPSGKVWAGVTFASYGTPTSCTYTDANNDQIPDCDAGNSSSIIYNTCFGKPDCSITANNINFSDPCVGTRKRLHVILNY
jgi:type IV secretory pathway VirB2 component (pilin)